MDLSGSERVLKNNIEGNMLKEAISINVQLHFLERVIVALQQKEGHVPYRSSLMTLLLRDSLGGNCFTKMITTISLEEQNIFESISSCQFS